MKHIIQIPTIDIKKYGGKQVAIVDGKIIATGNTLGEVIAKARMSKPSRPLHEIKIFAVPKTLSVIYYVAPVSLRHNSTRGRQDRIISSR